MMSVPEAATYDFNPGVAGFTIVSVQISPSSAELATAAEDSSRPTGLVNVDSPIFHSSTYEYMPGAIVYKSMEELYWLVTASLDPLRLSILKADGTLEFIKVVHRFEKQLLVSVSGDKGPLISMSPTLSLGVWSVANDEPDPTLDDVKMRQLFHLSQMAAIPSTAMPHLGNPSTFTREHMVSRSPNEESYAYNLELANNSPYLANGLIVKSTPTLVE